MCCFLKGTLRFGLIAVLVGGGVVAVAGHDRIGALLTQARSDINDRIDSEIDDAVALRAKLKDLESSLPKRISQVRSDLEATEEQIAGLEQERRISERVVALADRDLEALDSLLTRAENAHGENASSVVRVRFRDEVLSERQALSRAESVERLRSVHAKRAEGLAGDLKHLRDQRSRLETLLDEMETEHAQLENDLWHMDQRIDAIERNDRLITTMEKRERRIEEHSRYQSASLDEYERHLDEVRQRQEARLERLNGSRDAQRYEDRARLSLKRGGDNGRDDDGSGLIELNERIIELGSDSGGQEGADEARDDGDAEGEGQSSREMAARRGDD